MNTENEMKISFISISQNEGFARTVVSSFAALCDPDIEELADIRTAVSEAVTNCIVHAYRDTQGTVEITAKLLSGNELYIKIRDKGCGISDIKQAMEPLYTSAPFESVPALPLFIPPRKKHPRPNHFFRYTTIFSTFAATIV